MQDTIGCNSREARDRERYYDDQIDAVEDRVFRGLMAREEADVRIAHLRSAKFCVRKSQPKAAKILDFPVVFPTTNGQTVH